MTVVLDPTAAGFHKQVVGFELTSTVTILQTNLLTKCTSHP